MAQAKPTKRKFDEALCPNPMVNRVLNSVPEVTVRVFRAIKSWQWCESNMGILSQIEALCLASVVFHFFAVVTSVKISEVTTVIFICN